MHHASCHAGSWRQVSCGVLLAWRVPCRCGAERAINLSSTAMPCGTRTLCPCTPACYWSGQAAPLLQCFASAPYMLWPQSNARKCRRASSHVRACMARLGLAEYGCCHYITLHYFLCTFVHCSWLVLGINSGSGSGSGRWRRGMLSPRRAVLRCPPIYKYMQAGRGRCAAAITRCDAMHAVPPAQRSASAPPAGASSLSPPGMAWHARLAGWGCRGSCSRHSPLGAIHAPIRTLNN